MKQIIIALLCKGYTSTRKYTVSDLIKKLPPLADIIEEDEYLGIAGNSNKFWKYENNKNRYELIQDLQFSRLGDIRDTFYFHIYNRMENGDRYGIEPYNNAR